MDTGCACAGSREVTGAPTARPEHCLCVRRVEAALLPPDGRGRRPPDDCFRAEAAGRPPGPLLSASGRGGTSTYLPNVDVLFSHPSELRPQKDGRKVRPRDKGTSTSSRRHDRLDLPRDTVLCNIKVVLTPQIEPELRRCADIPAGPQSGIRRDAPAPWTSHRCGAAGPRMATAPLCGVMPNP